MSHFSYSFVSAGGPDVRTLTQCLVVSVLEDEEGVEAGDARHGDPSKHYRERRLALHAFARLQRPVQ